MAGWDIAGKNDTKPREAPFGRRSTCSLAASSATKGQLLTPAELRARFGGACDNSGCLKCGPWRAQRLLLPFASSLEHIKSPVTHIVLRWPVVDIGQAGLLPLSQFLDAARLLALLLQQGIFGDFDLWCLVSEVAAVNTSQAGPHLHLAIARTHFGLLPLINAIIKTWQMLGGEWQGKPACKFGRSVAKVLRYAAKGPLGKYYGTAKGEACAQFLLDRYEHMTWQSASIYYRGGTLVDPTLRRASQARARTLQVSADVDPRDHLGLARDEQLAKALPDSLAALDVEHTIRCPTCRRSGRRFLTRHGSDARGNQRWRCSHCKATFRDRPISQRQAEHFNDMRVAGLIRRLVDADGIPMHKAATKAHVGRQRAQRLYDQHVARWPKQKPALL